MEGFEVDPATADFLSVMTPGHFHGRGLASPRPETFLTNDPFNAEPPSAMVTFIIGGVLWVISFVMWIHRVRKLQSRTEGKLQGYDWYRALLACAIDNDSPYYTITSMSAISFLFLGGIQLDYQTTLAFMIGYYFIVSCGDSLRVLLAYWSYSSLREVFVMSEQAVGLKGKVEEDEREKDGQFETMELQPNNIYEDMGREKTIVGMIFLTQIILVSFVCIDIYRADSVRCLDGTPNCPVGGTAGSYGFYCMGIFQACVYLLGPKTSFGQSEQNPEFWLILLLASKKNGARLLWENPVKDPSHSKNPGTLRDLDGNLILDGNGNPQLYHQRLLNQSDWGMWRRFFMSYLVNGVCFHILVHALPIQVASQSSLTGVVFRAVGMLYLVDLDDSKGFRLIIAPREAGDDIPLKDKQDDTGVTPGKGDTEDEPSEGKGESKDDVEQMRPPGKHTPMMIDSTGAVTPVLETEAEQQAMAAEANEILEEAKYKLEMLREQGPSIRSSLGGGGGRDSRMSSGRVSRMSSARMSKPLIARASTRLNVISFGCKPAPSTRTGISAHDLGADKKKNTGQAALLQASTGMEAGAPGGAGVTAAVGGAGAGTGGGAAAGGTAGGGDAAAGGGGGGGDA